MSTDRFGVVRVDGELHAVGIVQVRLATELHALTDVNARHKVLAKCPPFLS